MRKRKNQSSQDFQISQLPRNRWQLFWDILKHNGSQMVVICLVFLLFMAPITIFRYYHLISVGGILSSGSENVNGEIQVAYLIYDLICIPIFLLMSLLLSGLSRIYKRMSFLDGYFLGADFFQGIKENWLDFLLLGLLYGILNLAMDYLGMCFLFSQSFVYYLMKILTYLFLLPWVLISGCASSIYSDPFLEKLFTSLVLYLKHFPRVLLSVLVLEAPMYFLPFSYPAVQLFLPLGYGLLYLPFAFLGFVLSTNHIFDKEINQFHFPELVNKGLYRPKDEQ